jgi:outer membrane protein OmpA-like peptidoglycan-associated protein
MMTRSRTITAAATLGLLSLAFAGPVSAGSPDAYSVEDVVSHFARAANVGATRSLCIGTATECGGGAQAVEPAPLDLRVQFQLNSAELLPEARQKLDVFATAARDPRLRRATFYIDGHTDALGSDTFNEELSKARAEAVVRYLVARGVDKSKLIARGYGKSKPYISDDAYDPRNRRVEASLAGVE